MTDDLRPDSVASARLGEVGRLWTSDLSVNEFALLDTAGFRPLEFVMGSSVFHVGWQQQNMRQSVELGTLSQAMYTARMNAMGRMMAEAAQVGADGVVGTRLTFRRHGISADHIEFIAVGTAVISKDSPGALLRTDGYPFSSHLNVQDFYTLLRTGHVPVEFVMGVCVWHVAAQGLMQTMRQMGQNVEMPQWTQGYYDARETALTRMQAEAERVQASGITGVEWSANEWMWGTHTLEFFTSGTAVRRVSDASTVDPTLVLPLG
ncbi:heavy metal-binding domain-containing protein [Nocardioides korecus]